MTRRTMRRKDRATLTDDAKDLLLKGEYGVLSTVGDGGEPYGVPLSYVFKNDCLYFHSALTGHKIENIESNPRVSFCVVGKTNLLPEQFATEYESAVAFGVASEAQGGERYEALLWLLEKYSPGHLEEGKAYIRQHDMSTKVVKITIDQISGKARR